MDGTRWAVMYFFLSGALCMGIGVGILSTIYMGVATFAYTCMCMGLYHRHHPHLHSRFMCLAMGIDVSTVLVLEWNRDALHTLMSAPLSLWQYGHIVLSSLAVVLYLPLGYLGWQTLQNRPSLLQKPWHKTLGKITFLLRTTGYILMFAWLKE